MRSILVPLLPIVLLAACSSPSTPVVPTTNPPAATSSRATPMPTPLTITPIVPEVCEERNGTVLIDEIDDPGLSRPLLFQMYLPPCYEMFEEEISIIFLFHGLGSDHQQWFSFGIAEEADRLIQDGLIRPVIIVSPWHRAGLDFESAIVEVLAPYVEANFVGQDADVEKAVGGLSRGAAWAFRIGFKHSHEFEAVGLHSPAVFEIDRGYLFYWVRNLPPWLVPDVLVDIGENDGLRPEAEQLSVVLEEQNVPFRFDVLEGDHTAEYWSGNLTRYLRWYDQALHNESIDSQIPAE